MRANKKAVALTTTNEAMVMLSNTQAAAIGLTTGNWRTAMHAQADAVSALRSQVLTLQAALRVKESELYLATEHLKAISQINKTT